MGQFSGKVIWVTGASSGIGAALASELLKQGAYVAVSARRVDRLQAFQKEYDPAGKQVLVVQADVTQRAELDAVVKAIQKKFGQLDGVIANAGFGVAGKFSNLRREDYLRQFDTNVWGVLDTAWAALEELKKSKGFLAILGSVAGHIAVPGQSAYSMSKFAVRAFAHAVRHELAASGVKVILISPGFVSSEIRQVNNQGQWVEASKDPVPDWLRMPAERASRTILKGIARKKSEIIVTGHGKAIVLWQRHLPGLLDWAMRRISFRGRPEPKA